MAYEKEKRRAVALEYTRGEPAPKVLPWTWLSGR